MEEFWAGVLWTLKIWLYLIVSLIMIPAMFGFSLGISEAYMTLLVKTLEVQASRRGSSLPLTTAGQQRHQQTTNLLNVSCVSLLSCSGPL